VARCFRNILLIAVLPCGGAAQTPGVSERLAEILSERGVIPAEDAALVSELARARRALPELDSQIDAMVHALSSRDDSTLRHRPGGGWRWTTADGRFSVRMGGRLTFRITHDTFRRQPETNDEDETDFRVRGARVRIDGHAFEDWLTYRLQINLAGDQADTVIAGSRRSSHNTLIETKDMYLDAAFATAFRLRAGQFKVPYSRHSMTGQARGQFVDRSITHPVFGRGRDVGVMVHGTAGGDTDSLIEWYAGAFDGEGENRSNDDRGLLWAARFVVNLRGVPPYRESDVPRSNDLRLAVGLNAWIHEDGAHASRRDDWSVGVDLVARFRGAFLLAELHRREDAQPGNDARPWGWLIQGGYFVVPDVIEIGLRAAHVDWDHSGDDTTARREYLAVVGWFLEAHALKIQLDFGRVEEHFGSRGDNVDGWRGRVQFQLMF